MVNPKAMGSNPIQKSNIAPSSNGRTSDFDSDNGGSNPSGTTMSKRYSED